mmetsp:Transcript_79905/g.231954  ORF Transcript_79905/g.231954 Transcript_79905/m.231954 type:complete len:226 (-) Transcript_79905:256-933(-)
MAPVTTRDDAAKLVDSNSAPPESVQGLELSMLEDRFRRVLTENDALAKELEIANKELFGLHQEEEELTMTWKASTAVTARQKSTAQAIAKNVQVGKRTGTRKLIDTAQHLQELHDVHRRLQSVNRQLSFAQELQQEQLATVERKIASRSTRARKIEQAIYRLVVEAQAESSLDRALSVAVAHGGSLVRSVLAREGQREALEIATREEAARREAAVVADADVADEV